MTGLGDTNRESFDTLFKNKLSSKPKSAYNKAIQKRAIYVKSSSSSCLPT